MLTPEERKLLRETATVREEFENDWEHEGKL